MDCILDANATSGPSVKCNQISLEVVSSFRCLDPSLGAERGRFWKDGRVAVDKVCGTADGGLFSDCRLDGEGKKRA